MSRFEEQIQNILQEEMEIPEIVNDKLSQAFSVIQQKKSERNKKRSVKRSVKVAVIAMVVILSVGTPVVAAVQHLGLFEYFETRNKELPQEANEMIVEEVEQQGKEGEYVDFWIREYMCDNNLVYVIVEAKPKQDNYLLIPQWVDGNSSVEELNIEGLTEGTIAEYATSQGKEIVYAGASIDTGAPTYSYDFQLELDGTAVYVISGTYWMSPDETEFTCSTFVQLPNITTQEEAIRDSFTFSMSEKSKTETLNYVITDTAEADALGILLDDVVITETELCTRVEFLYHYADDISEVQRTENDNIELSLVNESGNEYPMVKDGGGWLEPQEDGSFKEIRNYVKGELPSELTILIKNYETGVTYGSIRLEKE